jgi:hypothetical protein
VAHKQPSLHELAYGGYFFCHTCDQVCDLVDDGHGGNVCAWCRSPRFTYYAPVPTDEAITRSSE